MQFYTNAAAALRRCRLPGWTLLVLLTTFAGYGTSARAAVVRMTYDGVIQTAFGRSSLFGAPAKELVGYAYRAVYLFDTEVGRTAQDPTAQSAVGGTDFDEPSPWLGASLTVNGVTVQLLGDKRSVAATASGRNFARVSSVAVHNLDPEGFAVRSHMWHSIFTPEANSAIAPRLDQPFVYDLRPGDLIERADFEFREPIDVQRLCCSAEFSFTPQRVTVGLAVPEPATWAMMVTGLGLLGAVLRRRQHAGTTPSLRVPAAAS